MAELASALSNAAYRVSLRGTEAELEGGVQTLPWPAARVTAGYWSIFNSNQARLWVRCWCQTGRRYPVAGDTQNYA